AVDLQGPLALVQVTRTVAPAARARAECESVLDIALPERAALLSVEVGDGGRWRAVEATPTDRASQGYAAAQASLCTTPIRVPHDESATHRVTIAHRTGTGARPLAIRYRFSAMVDFSHGRQRLRFPASPEASPTPAEISVSCAGIADLDVAGVRAHLPAPVGARATVRGQATTRSGWEISYVPAAPPGAARAELEAAAAIAPLSDHEAAIAFSIHRGGDRTAARPGNVLFLI